MNKKSLFKRTLSGVLAASVVSTSLSLPTFAAGGDGDGSLRVSQVSNDRISAQLTRRGEFKGIPEQKPMYSENEQVRVSIVLEDKSTIEEGYSTENIGRSSDAASYRGQLKAKQDAVAASIERVTGETLDVVWNITLAANMISANVKYGQIEAIKNVSGVKDVVIETRYEPQVVDAEIPTDPNMSTSSAQIGSAAAWSEGYTGAGSRIAVIDTGIDFQHRSFDGGALMYSFEKNAEKKGVSKDEYIAGLDLLDKEELKTLVSQLNVNKSGKLQVKLNADDLYISEKIPFAFNYIDGNYVIDHEHDNQEEHGSHVEGIAAANAYVETETENCYKPALDEVQVQGVAPDAQILTMKVFGAGGGAYDADYMVAIEDAIILGADSINLSLGSISPGNSSYINPTEAQKTYQAVMDNLTKSGVVVCFSAGNNGHWAEQTPYGALYLDDVSMQTDGSPGSYTNGLTVASVDNAGFTGEYFKAGDNNIIYTAASLGDPFSTIARDDPYEYVIIDKFGTPEDWAAVGDTLKGKIAICSRGSTSFFEKANAAIEAGAVATIVYNNTSGTIAINAEGYKYTNPFASITQADGELLKSLATKDKSGSFYVGSLVVAKGFASSIDDSGSYTMSSFSSWGVPGSLELKPEVTAPGGNIYSVFGSTVKYPSPNHDAYENMSGTSMASPQVAGMMAVVAQYIRENDLTTKTGLSARQLAQSLIMSTAEPVMDGSDYSPVIQQGAGLANVGNAVNADAYILMDANATASYADGKVKAELGDDAAKNGVYSFSFTINSISDAERVYDLDADLFTQAPVQSQDGKLFFMDTSTMPLESTAEFTVDGKTATSATVPAGGKVKVDVTLKIGAEDKAFLDQYYTNGAYVEGYVYAKPRLTPDDAMSVIHSIPVLGYYGNWADPSMFDVGTLLDRVNGLEMRYPYLYFNTEGETNFFTIKTSKGERQFLGNPYIDDEKYDPARNALNSADTISSVVFSVIRNAAYSEFDLLNLTKNEIMAQEPLGAVNSAFYYANQEQWMNTLYQKSLNQALTGAQEGDQIIADLMLATEYSLKTGNLGNGSDLYIPFVIDNTAPTLIGDPVFDEKTGTLTVKASDNRYIAAVMVTNKAGTVVLDTKGTGKDVKPGDECTFEFDLGTSQFPDVLVQVCDYAMNATTYTVEGVSKVEAPEMLAYNVDEGNWTAVDVDVENAVVNVGDIAPNDKNIIAATAVDHIIFGVDADGVLYSAHDNDITSLTVVNDLGVTVNDLAYNPKDGNLYAISVFGEQTGLFPIDKKTGEWDINEAWALPLTNTLACDDDGNFYFNLFGTGYVCKFDMTAMTIAPVYKAENFSGTSYLQAMEWDSERKLLCWTACSKDGVTAYYEIDLSRMNGNPFVDYDLNGDSLVDMDDVQALLDYRVGVADEDFEVEPAFPYDFDGNKIVDTYDAYLYCEALKAGMLTNGGALTNGVTADIYELNNQLAALVIPVGGEYTDPDWAKSDKPTEVQSPDKSVQIVKGGTYQLSAYVLPWTVSDNTVVWSTSDPAIATVDANGLVTAVGEGNCVITAAANADNTVKTDIKVEVIVVEKTINGALQDVDGNPWLYEWDLTQPEVTSGADLTFAIASSTQADDGTLYIMDSSDGVYATHIVNPASGKTLATGSNTAGLPMWDLAYSEMFSTKDVPVGLGIYASLLVGPMNIMNITGEVGAWNFQPYLNENGANYFTAIAREGATTVTDEDDGKTYDAEAYWALDDAGNVWKIRIYPMDGSFTAAFEAYESDLNANFEIMEGLMYSSLVYDETDKTLYLSQFDGNTNNVYQFTFDPKSESFVTSYLGNFGDGVWPAVIYSVENNAPSAQSENEFVDDEPAAYSEMTGARFEAQAYSEGGSFEVLFANTKLSEILPLEVSGNENPKADFVAPETDETLSTEVSEQTMMSSASDTIGVYVYPRDNDGNIDSESTNGLVVVSYDKDALEIVDPEVDVDIRAQVGSKRVEPDKGYVVIGYLFPTTKSAPIAKINFKVINRKALTTDSVYAYYIENGTEKGNENKYPDVTEIDDTVAEQIISEPKSDVFKTPLIQPVDDNRPSPTRPSSGGSGGGSGSSGGSHHTPTTTPVKSETGSEGWSSIISEINKMSAGSTIVVAMNDDHEIPAEVIAALAEHDVILKASVAGYVWVIDGAAVTTVPTDSVDLGVVSVLVGIPASAISEVSGVKFTFSVNETDPFGFGAKLMVDMGTANVGKTAKLYLYDEASGKLVEVSSAPIGADGMALFENVTKGGKYAAAIAAVSGDVNGDGKLNALDAADMLKSAVGLITLAHPENGDVNGDGKVDQSDAVWVLKKSVGLV